VISRPNFEDWLYTPTEQPNDKRLKLKHLKRPIWTENKAKLIQRYLYYFVIVTKHGAYIDPFAGAQRISKLDAWSAKLVLEGQPKRFYLRNYYFIEQDKRKIPLLEALKQEHTPNSSTRRIRIEVRQGDCNLLIPELLASRPISDREATFCLLDQRTFECHWATLKALAEYKTSGNKIELFYFLPNSWLPRAVSRTKNMERLRLWWGRDDYPQFLRSSQSSRRDQVCERFKQELGYAYATPFPIFERKRGRRIMYYMIHATDHAAAPKLMTLAYNTAVLPPEPEEQFLLKLTDAGITGDAP
jgi:three-Cys-motif partner protein